MPTTVPRIVILMAVMLAGCLQAGTLDDIRVLEVGKTGRSASATGSLNLPGNGVATTIDRDAQNASSVQYSLSDNRKVKVQGWKVVLFTQPTCPYCRQSALMPKAFSQKTGFDAFPVSLDGKGDARFPNVLPATPDVMVEYFQSGLPVATPITSLINVSTMETWLLLQGAAEAGEFRSRLNGVLRMALDRQSGKSISFNAQGQQ